MPAVTAKTRTRDINRCRKLVDLIRGKIVSGEWKPGTKLPSRKIFEKQYGATNTVQTAFNTLVSEGYLTTESRIGTRVSDQPPHLRRFAVLLYGSADLSKSLHARALYMAAEELRQQGWDIEVFFILDQLGDAPECIELWQKINEHQFAGVFSEAVPVHWETQFFQYCTKVPLTGYLTGNSTDPDYIEMTLNLPGNLVNKSADPFILISDYLRETKVKRVAMLNTITAVAPSKEGKFRKIMQDADLFCPDGYYLEITERFSNAENICKLLFASTNNAPPDSLIVYNDNFLPYVISVLQQRYGKAVCEKVKIVTLCNYPALPDFDLPIKYIGYDQSKTLQSCLVYMRDLRQGVITSKPEVFLYTNGSNNKSRVN